MVPVTQSMEYCTLLRQYEDLQREHKQLGYDLEEVRGELALAEKLLAQYERHPSTVGNVNPSLFGVAPL